MRMVDWTSDGECLFGLTISICFTQMGDVFHLGKLTWGFGSSGIVFGLKLLKIHKLGANLLGWDTFEHSTVSSFPLRITAADRKRWACHGLSSKNVGPPNKVWSLIFPKNCHQNCGSPSCPPSHFESSRRSCWPVARRTTPSSAPIGDLINPSNNITLRKQASFVFFSKKYLFPVDFVDFPSFISIFVLFPFKSIQKQVPCWQVRGGGPLGRACAAWVRDGHQQLGLKKNPAARAGPAEMMGGFNQEIWVYVYTVYVMIIWIQLDLISVDY